MKKLALFLLLAGLTGVVSAQDYTQKEVRDQARNTRQQQQTQQFATAVQARNFTFAVSNMETEFQGDSPLLDSWNNYVAIYPGYLEVNLPYESANQDLTRIPGRLHFETSEYTNWEDLNQNGVWTVVFQAKWDVVTYTFRMKCSTKDGSGTLTLIPNDGNQVTYFGVIQPH